jgi:CRP-like cAMP-binding protein
MAVHSLAERKLADQDERVERCAHRLHRLAKPSGLDAFTTEARTRQFPVRTELLSRGQGITAVTALQSGWAGHVELFPDGRRQIVHLVLPGEIIAYPRPGRTLARSTVIALSPVQVSTWQIDDQRELAALQLAALSTSDAVDVECLSNQIARIGRRSAYERIAHLLLEIRERLDLAGLPTNHGFAMPLTQEVLADVLGLTNVHVNRTLQQLRAEGQIDFARGLVEIRDAETLMRVVDYRSVIPNKTGS